MTLVQLVGSTLLSVNLTLYNLPRTVALIQHCWDIITSAQPHSECALMAILNVISSLLLPPAAYLLTSLSRSRSCSPSHFLPSVPSLSSSISSSPYFYFFLHVTEEVKNSGRVHKLDKKSYVHCKAKRAKTKRKNAFRNHQISRADLNSRFQLWKKGIYLAHILQRNT